MEMVEILKKAVEKGASDIHVVVGRPPMVRVRGEIVPLEDFSTVNAAESKRLIYSVLFDEQRIRFEKDYELDSSTVIPDIARFRINVFLQKNGTEAVFRVIPAKVPKAEEIFLSKAIISLADLTRGLVLVTGPTGSGKSTTLACLVDMINQKYKHNILTVEDPIEFVYEHKSSVIRQREIGQHTRSFAGALKYALRQDPDIVLVGEMRDLETISAALTISETGHLVFATLHTSDAAQTVDRIIDVFPPHQQQQIRVQLGATLKAVISQVLIPQSDTFGRIAAREIMIVTAAIANLIREGKTHQIYNAIETGAKYGMTSLDKALIELMRTGKISTEDAVSRAVNKEFVRTGGRTSGSLGYGNK